MRTTLIAFLSGLTFGAGLLLSGMTRPEKVIGFLDLPGGWDPSLAFVMVGAIAVHSIAYLLVRRLPGPLLGRTWSLPTRRDIDHRLILGAALFGAGWGMAGYCPGPALTALPTATTEILLFTAAMLGGMGLYARLDALLGAGRALRARLSREARSETCSLDML